MAAVKRLINLISQYMQMLSGVFLVGIMLVTLCDVVTRTIFGLTDGSVDLTFVGGVELVKYGLLYTILFTLPQSIGSSQVIVDLFTEQMPDMVKRYLEGFYLIGFALLGAGMSYRFFLSIEGAQMTGETTQDLLIPMTWIYCIVVFATSMLTLRCFVTTCEVIHGEVDLNSSPSSMDDDESATISNNQTLSDAEQNQNNQANRKEVA
ncbi:MAG: TRAP transporter small permease [Vibrio sp.]